RGAGLTSSEPAFRSSFEGQWPSRSAMARSSALPARDRGRLPDPRCQLSLVQGLVLVDVEVAHFLVLGLSGGSRTQRRAAEERHLDVLREAVEVEEPALAVDAVERRVPLHRLAHPGNGALDDRIEAAPGVALPARH